MACKHLRIIGDNYGMTCQDCGEIIEGYGFWGQARTCIHRWAEYEEGKECIYCGEWVGAGDDLTYAVRDDKASHRN